MGDERKRRREERLNRLERIQTIGLQKCSALSKRYGKKATCSHCGKNKTIHSNSMCYSCYADSTAKGICKECKKRGVLKTGLCDSCYRKENYTGVCSQCGRTKVLKNKLCSTCYKRSGYWGHCRQCHEEDSLTGGLCGKCWDNENREGKCSSCGEEARLTKGKCGSCYNNTKEEGECEQCENKSVLISGLCRTCYDKDRYGGFCQSCGDYGVLVTDYCRSCYDHKDEMGSCAKCNNFAVLDHNNICHKCTHQGSGICKVCAKEKPIVFSGMCQNCYEEKTEGITHYMKSSVKKIIERLLGKKNFRTDAEEIYLEGESDPYKADFEMRDLRGNWCPAEYFNNKGEWREKYKDVYEFKDFYDNYLKPRNYILFTPEIGTPEKLKEYLIDRGFLQSNGLPHGKNVTKKKTKTQISPISVNPAH